MKKYYFLVILLIVMLYIFSDINRSYQSVSVKNDSYIDELTNSCTYKTIAKDLPYVEYILDYQIDQVIPFEDRLYSLNDIIDSIEQTTTDLKNNLALYYYNFDTKEKYAFNEDSYFVASS